MILNQLKQAGFRITAPRKAVIEVLQKNHEPQSAQMIHAKTHDTDLVSVYRALEVLERLEIVQREDMQGVGKYILAEKSHHHITCRKCGKIACVPCEHYFQKVKGFQEVRHQLTMTGICNKCTA
ncbi:MAG: Fur family transcriptional regulator [Patescibacteria group bacterium]